ncbi:MAG: def1 [Rickettsiaceae bacterium]|jgi:peptide deformylase|nr:def1 [Rickettsiaceae bacterium]
MTILPLIIAPNPIFKQKAKDVEAVDDSVRKLMDDMMETLAAEHAVGMGANMVGILKRIVVISLEEDGQTKKLFMVNPEVVGSSAEKQTFMEASICFPGISADITRPKNIKLKYLDYDGKPQELEAEGFLSTCIQHEIDYLDGKVFLDYLSPLKRDTLLRKMAKFKKNQHVHGEACGAGCGH